MKEFLVSLAILFFTAPTFSQIVIGGEIGAAGLKTESVLLDFAPNGNRGIILPYVEFKDPNPTPGSIILDVSDSNHARVMFYRGGDNPGWFNLSNEEDTEVTDVDLSIQSIDIKESEDAGVIIGADSTTADDGILVLESEDKAMVLPQVTSVMDIASPSPGMMVYVTDKDLLAVYNGKHWAFWKAEENGLHSGAFSLDNLEYTGDRYRLTGATNPREPMFTPDGKQFSIVSRDKKKVVVYKLNIPWDITTTERNSSKDMTFNGTVGHGHFIGKNGTKMFVWNRTECFQWDLSDPWNPSSAINEEIINFIPIAERAHDIDFSPDGLKFYFDDRNKGYLAEFHLATPWDLNTATFYQSKSISNQNAMRGMEFSYDGYKLFEIFTGAKNINEYHMTIPYDISTLSFYKNYDLSNEMNNPRSLYWSPEGKYVFIVDSSDRYIYKYKAY